MVVDWEGVGEGCSIGVRACKGPGGTAMLLLLVMEPQFHLRRKWGGVQHNPGRWLIRAGLVGRAEWEGQHRRHMSTST